MSDQIPPKPAYQAKTDGIRLKRRPKMVENGIEAVCEKEANRRSAHRSNPTQLHPTICQPVHPRKKGSDEMV